MKRKKIHEMRFETFEKLGVPRGETKISKMLRGNDKEIVILGAIGAIGKNIKFCRKYLSYIWPYDLGLRWLDVTLIVSKERRFGIFITGWYASFDPYRDPLYLVFLVSGKHLVDLRKFNCWKESKIIQL